MPGSRRGSVITFECKSEWTHASPHTMQTAAERMNELSVPEIFKQEEMVEMIPRLNIRGREEQRY